MRLLSLFVTALVALSACDFGGPDLPEVGGLYRSVRVDTTDVGLYSEDITTRIIDVRVPPVAEGDTVEFLPGTRIHATIRSRLAGSLADSLDIPGRVAVRGDSAVFLFDRGFPGLVSFNGVEPHLYFTDIPERIAAVRHPDGSIEWVRVFGGGGIVRIPFKQVAE